MPLPDKPIVALSGASGFIGSILSKALLNAGYQVLPFTRSKTRDENAVFWDPENGIIEQHKLEGIYALINLAGENIAKGRWSSARKQKLIDSRLLSTKLLCQALSGLRIKPAVFMSASAIGYYGSSSEKVFVETDPAGAGFLAELSRRWEEEAGSARAAGVRVIQMRLGVVLDREGGLLKRLLPVFSLGLGGRVGSGTQYMSWISSSDLTGAILHLLRLPAYDGPVNFVAPVPVTNACFASTLGSVLHRPTILPLPARLARIMLGEMADELLLKDQRVKPAALIDSGYSFTFPDIGMALSNAFCSGAAALK